MGIQWDNSICCIHGFNFSILQERIGRENQSVVPPTTHFLTRLEDYLHDMDRENPRQDTTNLFTSGLSSNGSSNSPYMSGNGIPSLQLHATLCPCSGSICFYREIGERVKRAGKLVAPSRRPTINLDFQVSICQTVYIQEILYDASKCRLRSMTHQTLDNFDRRVQYNPRTLQPVHPFRYAWLYLANRVSDHDY